MCIISYTIWRCGHYYVNHATQCEHAAAGTWCANSNVGDYLTHLDTHCCLTCCAESLNSTLGPLREFLRANGTPSSGRSNSALTRLQRTARADLAKHVDCCFVEWNHGKALTNEMRRAMGWPPNHPTLLSMSLPNSGLVKQHEEFYQERITNWEQAAPNHREQKEYQRAIEDPTTSTRPVPRFKTVEEVLTEAPVKNSTQERARVRELRSREIQERFVAERAAMLIAPYASTDPLTRSSAPAPSSISRPPIKTAVMAGDGGQFDLTKIDLLELDRAFEELGAPMNVQFYAGLVGHRDNLIRLRQYLEHREQPSDALRAQDYVTFRTTFLSLHCRMEVLLGKIAGERNISELRDEEVRYNRDWLLIHVGQMDRWFEQLPGDQRTQLLLSQSAEASQTPAQARSNTSRSSSAVRSVSATRSESPAGNPRTNWPRDSTQTAEPNGPSRIPRGVGMAGIGSGRQGSLYNNERVREDTERRNHQARQESSAGRSGTPINRSETPVSRTGTPVSRGGTPVGRGDPRLPPSRENSGYGYGGDRGNGKGKGKGK